MWPNCQIADGPELSLNKIKRILFVLINIDLIQNFAQNIHYTNMHSLHWFHPGRVKINLKMQFYCPMYNLHDCNVVRQTNIIELLQQLF